VLQHVIKTEASDSDVEQTSQCTSASCGGVFVAVFRYRATVGQTAHLDFVRAIPQEAKAPEVQPEVGAASPTFVEVYTQALAAETSFPTCFLGVRGVRET
jgi:hypothetical protein